MKAKRRYGAWMCFVGAMVFCVMGGCGKKQAAEEAPESEALVVEDGDTVSIAYVGSLEDGRIFDASRKDTPIVFTVGEHRVLPGFEKAVHGMKLNEEKVVKLRPEDAYGLRNETLVRKLPKTALPSDVEPKVGLMLQLRDEAGKGFRARIVQVTDNEVTVDLNHPLAGRVLVFTITVQKIDKADAPQQA